MNRFTDENLRAVKARVSGATGVSFGSESSGTQHVRGSFSTKASLRLALAAVLVIALGSISVFAVRQFRINRGVLVHDAQLKADALAERAAAMEAEQAAAPWDAPAPGNEAAKDYGIYDLDGNPVSPDDTPVFTDQDGNPVYPEPAPQAAEVCDAPDFGSLNGFVISFPFGDTEFSWGTAHHDGVDLAAPEGTPVLAAAAGTVSVAEFTVPYGNYVIIEHEYGYSTVYAHMSEILAEVGTSVEAGGQIGCVGATGIATGPHLHFELRLNGEPIDPADYWE
jgi:murein DD-endopeptidase MepM/ murein hydrolase activator NlpD